MPFGPYADFDECVAKNSDKSSPEGYCAWLHHKITGTWPGDMSADKYPAEFWTAYDAALTGQKSEKEAYQEAVAAAEAAGYSLSRFGWVKELQAPKMKTITNIRVFGAGTWTDSAGYTKTWTVEDLDNMVKAFEAGVPAVVPVKCGHTSDDFNRKIAEALGVPVEVVTGDQGQGQIAIGRMIALQRKGSWNIASFDKVPEQIANLIEGGQYSTVSVEIEDQVGDYGPVITGVALLGAEEPAVDGATLEQALAFGGPRKGARVYSFRVGDDIPMSELKAEFEDIRGKLAEIVKGKRGAPIFRALFGNLAELFERLTANHTAEGGIRMSYEPTPEALLQKGRPPKDWWDKCTAKVSGWPGVNDVDAFCGSVWYHDDPIPATSFAEGADDQATIKLKGGNEMTLPKALEGKKPEEVRAMKLPDLVKLFSEGDAPTVEELKGAFQEGDLAQVAAALGLGEAATLEDILAAIKAMVAGAAGPPAEGEMAKEFKKATDRIASLEETLTAERSLRDWETRTAAFKAIPGTPHEHALKLASIEAKAGKEAAEDQFKALEAADKLAVEATKIVGTTRTTGPTDFDNEVKKYMADHPDATKVQAIDAVSKAQPELYFARRDGWDQ